MTTALPRDRQRGNSLLLALIVMSALATLGSLTVVSVQSSLKASTNDRSQSVAMYAAESGAAIAIDFLRANYNTTTHWGAYVKPNNDPTQIVPLGPPALLSSGALPGTLPNPFSVDQNAWYSVSILNNRNDPGLVAGTDDDGRVIIQATGHGPQGSTAIIEVEIQRAPFPIVPPPVPLYPAFPFPFTPPPPFPAPGAPIPPAFAAVILVGWHIVNL